MKRNVLLLTLVLCILFPIALLAQASDYQTGKIVSVDKVSSGGSGGGTDAPMTPNRRRYNLSIQVGDTVYVCRADTSADMDLEWVQGKEVPVKVQGKTIQVKRTSGKIVKLSILSSKKSE